MSNERTPGKAPKIMSSRLLTMKFMQRAAASSPISSPSTPEGSSPKRRKTGDSSPATSSFDVNALANQEAIQAAMEMEEAKRQAALDRQAAEAGETRWVLNFEEGKNVNGIVKTPIRVVETGFASIDKDRTPRTVSLDEEDEDHVRPALAGRKSFGKFNRTIERLHKDPNADESSDSDSDDSEKSTESSEDEEDDPTGTNALLKEERAEAAKRFKEERKKKKKAEKKELLKLAKERKKKDVNINKLTSISGGNSQQDKRACHKCGEVGHLQADCPKRRRSGDDFDGSRPRKSRRSG